MEMLLDPNFCVDVRDQKGRKGCVCVCVWGAHLSCYRPHDPIIVVMAEVLYLAQSCDILASQVAQMEYSDRPLVV
jgi:hypothetical protein